jgi:hypothetical protein
MGPSGPKNVGAGKLRYGSSAIAVPGIRRPQGLNSYRAGMITISISLRDQWHSFKNKSLDPFHHGLDRNRRGREELNRNVHLRLKILYC